MSSATEHAVYLEQLENLTIPRIVRELLVHKKATTRQLHAFLGFAPSESKILPLLKIAVRYSRHRDEWTLQIDFERAPATIGFMSDTTLMERIRAMRAQGLIGDQGDKHRMTLFSEESRRRCELLGTWVPEGPKVHPSITPHTSQANSLPLSRYASHTQNLDEISLQASICAVSPRLCNNVPCARPPPAQPPSRSTNFDTSMLEGPPSRFSYFHSALQPQRGIPAPLLLSGYRSVANPFTSGDRGVDPDSLERLSTDVAMNRAFGNSYEWRYGTRAPGR